MIDDPREAYALVAVIVQVEDFDRETKLRILRAAIEELEERDDNNEPKGQ